MAFLLPQTRHSLHGNCLQEQHNNKNQFLFHINTAV